MMPLSHAARCSVHQVESELTGVSPELILGFNEKGVIAGVTARQVRTVRRGGRTISTECLQLQVPTSLSHANPRSV